MRFPPLAWVLGYTVEGDGIVTTFLDRAQLDRRMSAVDMQRLERMSSKEIGKRLGVTPQQVTAWFRELGYDALAYHIDSIAADVEGGTGFYKTLLAYGMSDSSDLRRQARAMLIDRGVLMPRVESQYRQDTRPRCECGMVLEGEELITGVCGMCQGERERETELEAELALFSTSAFLDNPRNIKRFDPWKTDCIRGVIPVW